MAVSLPKLLLSRSREGLLPLVQAPSWEFDFYLLLLLLTMDRPVRFLEVEALWISEGWRREGREGFDFRVRNIDQARLCNSNKEM
jgi:hypothetical protein